LSTLKQAINRCICLILWPLFLSMVSGCTTTSPFPLIAKLPANKTIRLMVLPFKDEPRSFESDYALWLRRELESRLVALPKVVLCANEEDLSTIVQVQDLFLTGLYEGTSSDKPISQLVNADYAAEGHLKRTSAETKVLVTLWDLKAGVILSSLEYKVPPGSTEVPSAYIRRFPQPYLMNQLAVVAEQLVASTTQTKAYSNFKIFPVLVKHDGAKATKSEQFLLARLSSSLKATYTLQENFAGPGAAYNGLEVLFKELKTPVYAKSKYLILELDLTSRGDYFDCGVSLLDSTNRTTLLKENFQFENSPAVQVYNAD